jgi:hypothetical protein
MPEYNLQVHNYPPPLPVSLNIYINPEVEEASLNNESAICHEFKSKYLLRVAITLFCSSRFLLFCIKNSLTVPTLGSWRFLVCGYWSVRVAVELRGGETDSRSATQISRLLWNPKAHHRGYKSLPPAPVQSTTLQRARKSHFINLPSVPSSCKWSLSIKFSDQNVYIYLAMLLFLIWRS